MARVFERTGAAPPPKSLTDDEMLVLGHVAEGVGEDELAVLSNLSLSEVYFVLSRLEQLGLVLGKTLADDDGSIPWVPDAAPLATVSQRSPSSPPGRRPVVGSHRAPRADRPTLSNFDLAQELARMSQMMDGDGPVPSQPSRSVPDPAQVVPTPPPHSRSEQGRAPGPVTPLVDSSGVHPRPGRFVPGAQTVPPHLSNADTPPASSQARDAHALYVAEYAHLPVEERVRYAREGAPDTLLALCFDTSASVLHAALAHPAFQLAHARVAARSHGTHEGLEAIAQSSAFVNDSEVRAALLGNPAASDTTIVAVADGTLSEIYKRTTDARIAERTRAVVRAHFQDRFRVRGSDERAAVIMSSEGACLALLGGFGLDARTSQILTGQFGMGSTLATNLARFPGAPPSVLRYLADLPAARNDAQFRGLLVAHPNLSEARKALL
jgi:hypothetical protein